jgi:hypothetical protein
MIKIENINKIVGMRVPMNHSMRLARIEDVYWFDTRYGFKIEVDTPNGIYEYMLFLNREKIPYPAVISNCWELSYEMRPNQLKVEALGKEDLNDMGEVIRRIGNLMERILNP